MIFFPFSSPQELVSPNNPAVAPSDHQLEEVQRQCASAILCCFGVGMRHGPCRRGLGSAPLFQASPFRTRKGICSSDPGHLGCGPSSLNRKIIVSPPPPPQTPSRVSPSMGRTVGFCCERFSVRGCCVVLPVASPFFSCRLVNLRRLSRPSFLTFQHCSPSCAGVVNVIVTKISSACPPLRTFPPLMSSSPSISI